MIKVFLFTSKIRYGTRAQKQRKLSLLYFCSVMCDELGTTRYDGKTKAIQSWWESYQFIADLIKSFSCIGSEACYVTGAILCHNRFLIFPWEFLNSNTNQFKKVWSLSYRDTWNILKTLKIHLAKAGEIT